LQNEVLKVAKMGHQIEQTKMVNKEIKCVDNSHNEQELRGCVIPTSFAWGSSCREEKVRATVLQISHYSKSLAPVY
jgi:hypothetical protein